MKQSRIVLVVLFTLALLLAVTAAYAQGILALPRWTIDSGGGSSAGGAFTLSGAIGQPDAAFSQGGSFTLSGGFWTGGAILTYHTFLPITVKN